MESDYSPVCSDIEDEDNNDDDSTNTMISKKSEKDNLNVMQLLEECTRTETELDESNQSDDEEKLTTSTANNNCTAIATNAAHEKNIKLIINLLSSVSHRMKRAFDLCTSKVVPILIKSCRVAFQRNGRSSRWDEKGAPLILAHIFR